MRDFYADLLAAVFDILELSRQKPQLTKMCKKLHLATVLNVERSLMPLLFTVFGSTGFIGSCLVSYLKSHGIKCFTPSRNDTSFFSQPLGHVIYCAGYTSDFQNKTLEIVEAHVCSLQQIIAHSTFDSLLYLSSTRIYQKALLAHEESPLIVNPNDLDAIYNISKLMGESLCLNAKKPNMRVVRLSNIYGPTMGEQNFLGSLIYQALEKKEIFLKSSMDSSKDYLFIEDLLPLLVAIAKNGKEKLYICPTLDRPNYS